MKRIALAFATFGILAAGSFAAGAEPMMERHGSALNRHATHRVPYAAAQRGPYAAAGRGPYAAAGGPYPGAAGRGPNDSATHPGEQAPPPSIPYDADGPAYLQGQTKSTDFQLQH